MKYLAKHVEGTPFLLILLAFLFLEMIGQEKTKENDLESKKRTVKGKISKDTLYRKSESKESRS